jgi:hypothetical protein
MEGRRRKGKEINTKEERRKRSSSEGPQKKTRPMGPKPTFAPSQDLVPASSFCPGT